MYSSYFLTLIVLILTLNVIENQAQPIDIAQNDKVPVSTGLTGFISSLVTSYQHIKLNAKSTLEKWSHDSFNVTETPEIIHKRRLIWGQLTEARFG